MTRQAEGTGTKRAAGFSPVVLFVIGAIALAGSTRAAEPPVIPVGLDAYRMWDRWPYQRIGDRVYMRSTYDRRGLNEGGDASHFLYQLADDNNVTLDVEGTGVLYFVRTNHWHGSPWRYTLDGAEHIVKETSTADPDHPVKDSTFLPADLFPPPLTWTWSTTKGADLNWVPMPFERSLRLAYSRTFYGTGYYIYHLYDPGAKLSQPIKTWDGTKPPAPDVLDLIGRAGTDLVPKASGIARETGNYVLGKEAIGLGAIPDGKPGMIRGLQLSVSRQDAIRFGKCRLRITWDNRPAASVDAPIALFFGAGTLYNRDSREYLVKGFPLHIRYEADRVNLSCFYPMPFMKSAKIELLGNTGEPIQVQTVLQWKPYDDPPNHVGYFHATYIDHAKPRVGHDLVILDTREAEGGGDWSGQFVGMSWIFSHNAGLSTLEGDPRFFFDDSQTPQCYGTGTEEWGGGGDYWGGENMTLPFAGHPVGTRKRDQAKCDEDKIESAYRFLLADQMPFGRNAVIRLEHGDENKSTEHYESVAYWYGRPAATLVQTDELKIADETSEKAHAYVSPQASEPVEITSRYEWGPDTLDGKEIYPPHTDRGRFTKGTSEFTLNLQPGNLGVLLRRKLDYAFPNQRAEVYVLSEPGSVSPVRSNNGAAPESKTTGVTDPGSEKQWRKAGIWYLAGSNTCIFSWAKTETGPTEHNVQTSNRRFRDDEFIIPRALTRGQSKIRVRVVFTPVERPLFPGHPMADLAWSELKYTAYCWVMPQ